MSHSKTATESLKIVRSEVGVSKYMPITHLDEPTVFEALSGMVGSVIRIAGVPFDTETDEVLNSYKRTLHRAVTSLNEEFCIYATIHRHKEDITLTGKFKNRFAEELDRKYHAKFKDQAMYINDIYFTVIYKGITTGKAGKGLHLVKRLSAKTIKSARDLQRQTQIKALKKAVTQLLASLSGFQPHLLGSIDAELGYSELLTFYGLFVNGGESIKFNYANYAPPIARSIPDNKKVLNLYPHGNLAQYITNKRIFFGDCIQFQGSLKSDTTFAAIVTIKQYTGSTSSIMLDTLLHLDCDFISTNTFALEAKDLALKLIQRDIVKKENANDPAVSELERMHIARDMVASGEVAMGYHHNTVMLLAKSKEELEQKSAHATKCYAEAGFAAIAENIGLEPAFWAQIPCNQKYIARSAMITSENFVDFAPMHNYRTGFKDGNHLGSAVTLLETPSKTPYFFNFHVKGSKDNPSKGHTIFIGGNNSGKTVLTTFLDAQISRYGGDSFGFDRNRGMEIYYRLSGGYYSVLSPDHPDDTRLNPLQLPDTPVNRKFCREWLAQLVKKDDEAVLDDEIMKYISQCIEYNFEHLAKEHRKLSNIAKLLPINFPRWASLRRWLRKDHAHPEGEYAYLFDNDTDELQMHSKMGFDMTHFLDHEPSNVLTALSMYLMHRLNMSLDGRLVSIWIDEGWQFLQNPYWQHELRQTMPTYRKLNAHLNLATQSPHTVLTSPIRHVIMDNIAQGIYFANPNAKEEEYMGGLNLTRSEYAAIANNDPSSRLFLIKQDQVSTLCRLNLAHMPDELAVMSGNQSTVRLLDELRREFGDDPEILRPLFYKRRRELRI